MASKTTESEYLEMLAKSWNNLDVSFIEPVLAGDVVYESQWVLTPLKGKEQVLAFLKSKFGTIRDSVALNGMLVLAETGRIPKPGNRPCIVLTQTLGNEINRATLLIEIQNKMISRIDVCFIPNPLTAELTGKLIK